MFRGILPRLALTLGMMGLIALGVVGYTLSGKNGTLVRNSLVASALDEDQFSWLPGNEPADFLLEKRIPPQWFQSKFEASVSGDAEFVQIESAIRALHKQRFSGKAIRKDLETTWALIEKSGRGYCADYSKLFNAMMLAADIPVREWALGHENFGSGHTFNEVYLERLGKWVFVDAFNGMVVRDAVTGEPYSVLEFRQVVAERAFDRVAVQKYTNADDFFQTREEALNYYARSSDYFYLLWGNNVFSYEANPWIQRAASIAREAERLVAILLGEYPQIRMLSTQTNAAAITKIRLTRWGLMIALALEVILGLYLLVLARQWLRSRKEARGLLQAS